MRHEIPERDVDEREQDRAFADAIGRFGPALARMARGYEADPDLRRDLEQDIQIALWQSFARFDGRCALSTWVWRVAHNRATSHMIAHRRRNRSEEHTSELQSLMRTSYADFCLKK